MKSLTKCRAAGRSTCSFAGRACASARGLASRSTCKSAPARTHTHTRAHTRASQTSRIEIKPRIGNRESRGATVQIALSARSARAGLSRDIARRISAANTILAGRPGRREATIRQRTNPKSCSRYKRVFETVQAEEKCAQASYDEQSKIRFDAHATIFRVLKIPRHEKRATRV
jgi:hypothetical protein